MICVAVTYEIQPGREPEAIELFRKLTAATRAEPGCRLYLAHQSTTDPSTFFLYEQYDNQAALDSHRASPHFDEYGNNGLFPLLVRRTPAIYQPLED